MFHFVMPSRICVDKLCLNKIVFIYRAIVVISILWFYFIKRVTIIQSDLKLDGSWLVGF